MTVVPLTLAQANALIVAWHRHHKPAVGHRFSIGALLSEPAEYGLERVRSTASLSTSEFTDYIERCRKLAAELGIYVPDPGETA